VVTATGQEERLAARLLRGAVGGIVAGVVFAGVTMWFTESTAGKADMPLRMISTIVKGDKAMAAGTTSVGLGVLVHLVLSALFGMLFALAVNGTTSAISRAPTKTNRFISPAPSFLDDDSRVSGLCGRPLMRL